MHVLEFQFLLIPEMKIMNKEIILITISETAYNVGFSAKLHFASFDIISKSPNRINVIVLAIGIILLTQNLSIYQDLLSAILIIMSILSIVIGLLESKCQDYEKAGKKLTEIFQQLKILSRKVEFSQYDLNEAVKELEKLTQEYNDACISDQVWFANWSAHYKFFWEQDIEWITKRRKFSFFRDKIPLDFIIISITLIASLVILLFIA